MDVIEWLCLNNGRIRFHEEDNYCKGTVVVTIGENHYRFPLFRWEQQLREACYALGFSHKQPEEDLLLRDDLAPEQRKICQEVVDAMLIRRRGTKPLERV